MATLQKQIATRFLIKLAESDDIDAAKLAQLKALLDDGKKAKADDFVRVFNLPAGGDLE